MLIQLPIPILILMLMLVFMLMLMLVLMLMVLLNSLVRKVRVRMLAQLYYSPSFRCGPWMDRVRTGCERVDGGPPRKALQPIDQDTRIGTQSTQGERRQRPHAIGT